MQHNMGNNQTILGLIFVLLCLFSNRCLSLYLISVNQTLHGNQTLVSAGGSFELGFFTPGESAKYYVGMWYKRVAQSPVVWVANRATPLSDKDAAQLRISNGNLVILDGAKNEIWSTGLSPKTSGDSLAATLLDDGNLVLRDGSSNFTVWQSFDNPTDTWLPGGKLAYDKRTQKTQLLTSWKNSQDPSPGLFSLELVPTTKEYVLRWNRTQQYWTSGAWNDYVFSEVPEMRLGSFYTFTFVDNEKESYFTYSVYNSSPLSRFIIHSSGQIQQLMWTADTNWNMFWSQPSQQCQVYTYCGAFAACNENDLPFCDCLNGCKHKSEAEWSLKDYSGGCVREVSLQCESRKGKRDKFLMHSYMKLPDHSIRALSLRSEGECKTSCLNNCSCSAYAFDENGCSVWNGELLNLQRVSDGESGGKAIYIKLAAASSVFAGKGSKDVVLVAAACSSAALVLIIPAIILVFVWTRRARKRASLKTVDGSLVAFGYKDLQNATKNFSQKLGGGGFGSVFKGTLPDSSAVAVKKLESISQGEKQFRSEVSTIGTIQHVNLVRLRGFCSKGSKKLLVYDYMENGSLNSHLFHANESTVLGWKTRYQVALGTARGLAYLHEKCVDCIIHCDIKPGNILLDGEFCPKVADFGLAKLLGRDFSRVLTTMRGTRGYLAPEWISGVAITAKADVFSYGMMMFELVSGRRNSQNSDQEEVEFFPSLAASLITSGGDVLSLLDPMLSRKADAAEVMKVLKIAVWCVQEDETFRPSSGQIVQILEGIADVNVPPIPRSLAAAVAGPENALLFTESSSSDLNSKD